MKVGALFTDYDGTNARQDVKSEQSEESQEIARPLIELSRYIPIAIVTSKDYAFVRPRTDFASAWACCSGLEISIKNGKPIISPRLADLRGLIEDAQESLSGRILVEGKGSRGGKMIGFCLDWTGTVKPKGVDRVVASARRRGLFVDHARGTTFVDVYAGRPDKGKALVTLRQLLGVKGSVAYMGDSPLDNPAFDASDIAIAVTHGRHGPSQRSDFEVRFDSLGKYLEGLIRDGLEWNPARLAGGHGVEA